MVSATGISTPAKKLYPAARADSLSYNGDGANIIFVDYQQPIIVAVVRWIDGTKMKEFVRLSDRGDGRAGALTSAPWRC